MANIKNDKRIVCVTLHVVYRLQVFIPDLQIMQNDLKHQ